MNDKRPVGRPTKYDPAYCEAVVEHMADGASLTSFAASIGVSRSVINLWIDANPEFMQATKRGKAVCAAWWERIGRNQAISGQGNATLVIFGLKNMASEDWKDRKELNHQSSDGSMSPTRIEIVPGGTDSQD